MKTLIAIVPLIVGAGLNELVTQTRWDGYREALEIHGARLMEEQEIFVRKAVEFERLQAAVCADYFAKSQIRRVQVERQMQGVCN